MTRGATRFGAEMAPASRYLIVPIRAFPAFYSLECAPSHDAYSLTSFPENRVSNGRRNPYPVSQRNTSVDAFYSFEMVLSSEKWGESGAYPAPSARIWRPGKIIKLLKEKYGKPLYLSSEGIIIRSTVDGALRTKKLDKMYKNKIISSSLVSLGVQTPIE